jgi:Ca2+-binding RTX toxin-like protein
LSADGTATGNAAVENYVLAADTTDTNIFTLGAAGQNVTAGVDDDTVHTGAFTSVTSTLNLGGGIDTLVVDTTATNISAATTTQVENIVIDGVDVTMTIAQNAKISSASGTETVTLSIAGTLTANAAVEAYVLANGTNDITLTAVGQDVTGGTGADTIRMLDTDFSTSTIDGNGATDTIRITSTGAATVVDASFTLVSDVETLVLESSFSGHSVTLGLTAQGAGITTVDISAVTSGISSVDASGYAVGLTVIGGGASDTMVGGSGADILIAGAGNDNLTGNGGDDTFRFLSADFTSLDTVAGGGQTQRDTIEVTDTATVVDADFTAVTGVERLLLSANGAHNITVGTAAVSAGVNMIDATAATTSNVTVNATSFNSSALTITTSGGADTITLGAASQIVNTGAGNDTVNVNATTISSTIDAGSNTGPGDTLNVTGGGTVTMGVGVTGFEKVVLAAAGTTFNANDIANLDITGTIGIDNITSGNAAQTVNAGSGNDIITLGASLQVINAGADNDSVNVTSTTITSTINGGGGTDTLFVTSGGSVTMGAGITFFEQVQLSAAGTTFTANDTAGLIIQGSINDDVIIGGAGANAITGGAGADTLTGSGGADSFVFDNILTSDTITDFTTASDLLKFDLSVFDQIGSLGAFSVGDARYVEGAFTSGQDGTDRIIFNTTTGALYYDADGNGVGAEVQIAALTSGAAALDATDIFVF